MKLKFLCTLLLSTILVGCSAISSFSGFTLEEPDHKYEIDTWLANSEVYEFTPKSNPNISCVTLILDSGRAMGLQCFYKVVNNNQYRK